MEPTNVSRNHVDKVAGFHHSACMHKLEKDDKSFHRNLSKNQKIHRFLKFPQTSLQQLFLSNRGGEKNSTRQTAGDPWRPMAFDPSRRRFDVVLCIPDGDEKGQIAVLCVVVDRHATVDDT